MQQQESTGAPVFVQTVPEALVAREALVASETPATASTRIVEAINFFIGSSKVSFR
jgi:hypothetical protein